MTGKDNEISIWFFIGISLLVNGVLIAGAGVYELFNPPANPVVLHEYRASLWWGAILAIAGAVYCLKFRPGHDAGTKELTEEVRENVHVG